MDEPAETRIIQDDGRRTRTINIHPRPRAGGSLVIVRERPSRTWRWRLRKGLLFTVILPFNILLSLGMAAVETWKLAYRDDVEVDFVTSDFIHHETGADPWTPELREQFARRDGVKDPT